MNGGFFCTQTPSQSEFMEVKFETKKYWLEKSKLYGKQAILRWLQKENIDTTPNSWQERYHL